MKSAYEQDLLCICLLPMVTTLPGFKNVIIKPDFVSDLSWVKGEYQSLYGIIKSQWKREGDNLILNIDIPANTTATIFLPTDVPANIAENGSPVLNNNNFVSITPEKGKTIVKTGSGHYSFSVKLNH